ncbi:MAG: hypothetical protein AAFY25_05975 [Pseudomonadota bacterium]
MRDLDTLETRVARDRADLVQSLDALSATVAPQRIATEVSQTASSYGGEIGRQAWAAARQNPAAFALVGTGLALLVSGAGKRRVQDDSPAPSPVASGDTFEGFDERVAKAHEKKRQDMTGTSTEIHDAARLRSSLERGLDKLPAAARSRVIRARRAALQAQEKLEATAKATARKTGTLAHQQPLVVGAVALGLGALVGSLLPGTRKEDDLLGARRDALMQDAETALRAEMDHLRRTAQTSLDKGMNAAEAG